MGFFKRNWRELLVAGLLALSVIALAIILPYTIPALCVYTLITVAPFFAAFGITAPLTMWVALAAIGATVFGAIGGLFTKAVRACCTPKVETLNFESPANPPLPAYVPPVQGMGQQDMIATFYFMQANGFTARWDLTTRDQGTPVTQKQPFLDGKVYEVNVGNIDPTGTLSYRDHTGTMRIYSPAPQPALLTTVSPTAGMEPVYIETVRPTPGQSGGTW